jgi:serine phosphatase RsbU (regulator of sigma subunit)/pSer/pThr/pTyr-binding forkhead associated (FHA) protein
MAKLVLMQGPEGERSFPLEKESQLIGRQHDCPICLEALAVSRLHARIFRRNGSFVVEDVGSRGGTYVNGNQVLSATELTEGDRLQIGPYTFGLQLEAEPPAEDPPPVISAQITALSSNRSLFTTNPAQKLQVVLEITQNLARTLDLDVLLGKLLEQLLRLFPQAERGMVLILEPKRMLTRDRHGRDDTNYHYSRTLVRKVLDEGIGVLSEDLGRDKKIVKSETLLALKLHSVLCVPLLSQGRRLGVIQLDVTRPGLAFKPDDLELLTAVALHVAVVLDNAALHAERLREERMRRELALAREIQQGFLPLNVQPLGDAGFDLYARVQPAREVSGDLYDFFSLPGQRLAFLVGDVSGKGMPAALFMVAVRTLCRHLIPTTDSPSEMLTRLNAALAADNPATMFVTLIYGIYDAAAAQLTACCAGHPAPLLRHADGSIDTVTLPIGRLIGIPGGDLNLHDATIDMKPGDTFVLYTDGFTEARTPDRKHMFEIKRLMDVLAGPKLAVAPLKDSVDAARNAIERYTGTLDQDDDRTLLLLRRKP